MAVTRFLLLTFFSTFYTFSTTRADCRVDVYRGFSYDNSYCTRDEDHVANFTLKAGACQTYFNESRDASFSFTVTALSGDVETSWSLMDDIPDDDTCDASDAGDFHTCMQARAAIAVACNAKAGSPASSRTPTETPASSTESPSTANPTLEPPATTSVNDQTPTSDAASVSRSDTGPASGSLTNTPQPSDTGNSSPGTVSSGFALGVGFGMALLGWF
ncbi:hypothetical protein CC78DRAFT_528606 [Lojkania enalia]|uniref:Uncharacterized protein n=1 Tax=Lojkania enalia TaxID=147567 RepID=A0A9P4TR61_9PLEO|nr:hypothetical protein CC78DRAFT_528606 [Didymosphaeria enalia]